MRLPPRLASRPAGLGLLTMTLAATLAATALPAAAAQPPQPPVGPASLCERGGGQVIFIACAGGVYNGYVVVAGRLYRPQHGTGVSTAG